MRALHPSVAVHLCLLAVSGVNGFKPSSAQPIRRSPSRAIRPPLCVAPTEADALDLVGDGGVLKAVLTPGEGARPPRGATVEVHYEGRLADTGAVFDSSRARGKPFTFTLGEGKVIGGWEVGVSSMQTGELSEITCSPQYAYGAKGIPPMIPPSATLRFEVELLSIQSSELDSQSFADDNSGVARTPGAISAAYASKMAAKEQKSGGLAGAFEWAKSIYIFGFFASKDGERPPWYLNPLITFPGIFAIVGAGFYLVVLLGGIHRGEAPTVGDDLSSFIGETFAP